MWEFNAKVVRVIDGDTIDVDVDLGFYLTARKRLRFSRIDTPERGEVNFTEATDRVKELTPVGSTVRIVTGKAGGFGRWLAEIYYGEDNRNLNDQLLQEGLAKLYKK